MEKPDDWFVVAKFVNESCGKVTVLLKFSMVCYFTKNSAFSEVFFTQFASENQLPGLSNFSIIGNMFQIRLESNISIREAWKSSDMSSNSKEIFLIVTMRMSTPSESVISKWRGIFFNKKLHVEKEEPSFVSDTMRTFSASI